MKRILAPILLTLSISCGSEPAAPKALFSTWFNSDTGSRLYLEGLVFGVTQDLYIVKADLTACAMDLTINGTDSSGTYQIANDTCGIYDGLGTFTNDGTTLTLCEAGVCSSWR